jgi:hypothetical protein
LEETIARLEEQMRQAASLSPPPAAPAVRHSEPKIAAPEYFSGQRSKLTTFLTQVSMVIELQPSRYPTERSKVLYAASFLRDTAFLWFQPNITKEPEPEMMQDFRKFTKLLKETFGDPDEEATAERNLFVLHQKGSASSYISEFQRHATLTNWDDHALAAQFYRGLKEGIKDEIARVGRPHALKEMMDTALRIDNRLYERTLERGNPMPYTTTTQTKSYEVNRDRSSSVRSNNPIRQATTTQTTYTCQSYQPNNNRSYPNTRMSSNLPINQQRKLKSDEYARRKEENLCLYCGSKDHAVANCPVSKTKTANARGAQRAYYPQAKEQAVSNKNHSA